MKVVLFCGGLGLRLRSNFEITPKPLVKIGHMPILWHIMRYYSFFGFNDFILCLGYKADEFKKFFLNHIEYFSNDFLMNGGSKNISLFDNNLSDWKIAFIDTGFNSNIGQRLKSIEKHLGDEDIFMANYSDVLTDLPLTRYLDCFQKQGNIASFLGVRPYHTFHVVTIENGGVVTSLKEAPKTDLWINGGYFIFRKEIFNYLQNGEDLVQQPFQRLMVDKQLISYKYNGFWGCMDTFKDKQELEDLFNSGCAPWEVWKKSL